ncbi:MAG: flavocytochrome c [Clostridiales bacterium]|nr:flavocytochrome c [Clostridiales bacterium]
MNTRRLIAVLLVIMLAIPGLALGSFDLTSADEQAEIKYNPGTYTATKPGHEGDVTVEVTFSDSKIETVKVTEHKETAGVADPALDTIPAAIVEEQALVDVVASASFTSRAILDAVSDCVVQAGADPALLVKKTDESEQAGELVVKKAPAIVVGAGGAGLAAAVKLGELGTHCILIEKMPAVGGNTARSGAAYNAVDPELQERENIEDSIELHIQQTYEGGDKLGDMSLITVLCENALDSIHWLEGHGVEFQDKITAVIGAMYPRTHYPINSIGSDFTIPLERIAKEQFGQEILVNTKATELIVEEGRVIGVKAVDTTNGTPYEFYGENGVILTTGGFGADIERCRSYNPNIPADIRTSNQPGATGEGIDMAVAIGAEAIGMEYIQMLPIVGNCVSTAIENQIFVNVEGNRFVREDGRRDVMSNAVLEQTGGYMYMIADQKVADTSITGSNLEDMLEKGVIYRADTLEELAAQIGVDADNLVKTVAAFNERVEAGVPDEFGREVFDNKLDTAPYWASAKQVPILHHTMGGLKIDTKCHVINTDGEIIPGLFAAGEVTGGIHGANRLGGNALADIFVFGRIAAETLVESAK